MNNKGADQTVGMHRVVHAFVVCKLPKTGTLTSRSLHISAQRLLMACLVILSSSNTKLKPQSHQANTCSRKNAKICFIRLCYLALIWMYETYNDLTSNGYLPTINRLLKDITVYSLWTSPYDERIGSWYYLQLTDMRATSAFYRVASVSSMSTSDHRTSPDMNQINTGP